MSDEKLHAVQSRITDSEYEQLSLLAKKDGRSVSNFVAHIIRQYICTNSHDAL